MINLFKRPQFGVKFVTCLKCVVMFVTHLKFCARFVTSMLNILSEDTKTTNIIKKPLSFFAKLREEKKWNMFCQLERFMEKDIEEDNMR